MKPVVSLGLEVLQREYTLTPRAIDKDKNGSYVKVIAELKDSGELPESCEQRPIVKQDRWLVRWRVSASQYFKDF